MRELRRLLLGAEIDQLAALREEVAQLRQTLADPAHRTERVAQILSEAMLVREHRDRGVSKALQTSIAEALRASVGANPAPVAEAVAPVIGPAIRRAVRDTIAGMLEAFDKLVEHNLSWRSIQWRLEAWRTGRRYSEVLLLRTLIYRVERVLLIHPDTGSLLCNVASPLAGIEDPDPVGNMPAVVKDFVADSLSAGATAPVETLHVGELVVMVVQGQKAMVAAIVRGTPPSDLGQQLEETREQIELMLDDALAHFDGDPAPFSLARIPLADCLRYQEQPRARRATWVIPSSIALVILVLVGVWAGQVYQRQRLMDEAIERLRAEPGIVVTSATRQGDRVRVGGLADPVARNPREVVGPAAFAGLDWQWDWRTFYSSEPQFVLQRAMTALHPPETVHLGIAEGALQISGEAPLEWFEGVRDALALIPGLAGYQVGDLELIDAGAILKKRLAGYRGEIEDTALYFDMSARELGEDQLAVLDGLADRMKRLESIAGELGTSPRYIVTGYVDHSGSRRYNRDLSLTRAYRVVQGLVAQGIPDEHFLPSRMGVDLPSAPDANLKGPTKRRRVTVEVLLLDER